jgi:hypothetical protein
MQICGITITDHAVIVVGDGKVIKWDLPLGDNDVGAMGNINNSVQTIPFEPPFAVEGSFASISPDLKYFAIVHTGMSGGLHVYSAYTGEKLAAVGTKWWIVGFTPGKHEVWCSASDGEVVMWKISQKVGVKATELNSLQKYTPLSGFPWHSPCGHQVTSDGWILSSDGKWLLWLPHRWRPKFEVQRKWGRECLALWGTDLAQPVILKLDV